LELCNGAETVDGVVIYTDKEIAAVKEALAQTQEPVAWEQFYPDIGKPQIEFAPVKIVAYNCTCGRTMKFESVHGVVAPQRTWVGLTDEEIAQGWKESWVTEQAWQSAVWWAEAKLKQKNHVAQETNS
jgi:hypothetical protein